ncbi:hypothetical protein ACHAPA_007648 [Fusarium lateritium]
MPLDDPVATFGAKLATAPLTPTLSSGIAGPDHEFLQQLDQRLNLLTPELQPKCMRSLYFINPDEQHNFSDSDSDSDSDNGFEPWTLRELATKMFTKAGIAIEAERLNRKRQDEEPIQDTTS